MNAADFLQTLFAGADHGYSQFFWLPSASATSLSISKISVPTQLSGENMYFSPGLSSDPKDSKLSEPEIIGVPAMWIDIDILNPEAHKKINLPADIAEAQSLIPDDLPPSLTVFSGYGLQLYWIFRECWYFETTDERQQAAALLSRLQVYIRQRAAEHGWHMDSTSDICRVMRLPGSLNHKIKTAPIMAQVIESCDARYNPSELLELIPEIDITTGQRIRKAAFERRSSDGPAAAMLSNCAFFTHVQMNTKTLSYQEMLAAATNIVRATDGIEKLHEILSSLETYNRKMTDKKIDEALNNMNPQSCEYIRRELGFLGCPAGGCDVQAPCGWSLGKVPQARALLRSISIPTAETVYTSEVTGALAIVQKSNPVEFDLFMQRCKGQVNQNTLRAEIKKQRLVGSGLTVHEGGKSDEEPATIEDDEAVSVDGKTLVEAVPDVPIDLQLPRKSNVEAWKFGKSGVTLVRTTLNGQSYNRASHTPILITERIYNVDSQTEKARVAFKTRHGWRSQVLPKSTIFSSRGIMCLANAGVTLNEEMAKHLAKWLSALEAANIDAIPEKNGVSKLGWRNREQEFVLPGLPSGYTLDTGAEADGIISSIGPAGDPVAWINAMSIMRNKTRARFILAAAFAAPLLKIIGQRTFLIYNWGDTTDGKTATLQAALSVWGRPESLMLTFNNTQASLEKMAEFFTDLPLGINEYETINDRRKTDQADQIIYMIAEGHGKGRANKDGSRQRSASWRTVSLMTGEGPITRAASKAGIITRVLELHGGPLRGEQVFASGLYRLLDKNYGHAGQLFIQRLLAENHDALAEQYNQTRFALRQFHPASLESHVDAVSCVVLADYLASQWVFGASEQDAGQQSVAMGQAILSELISKGEANESARGWDWLQDWMAANKQRFEYLKPTDIDGTRSYTNRVVGTIYGYVEDSTTHIIKTELTNALRDSGFSPDKLYRAWATDNRISVTLQNDGRTCFGTKKQRFNGAMPWVISVKT